VATGKPMVVVMTERMARDVVAVQTAVGDLAGVIDLRGGPVALSITELVPGERARCNTLWRNGYLEEACAILLRKRIVVAQPDCITESFVARHEAHVAN
jgi:hypothetical protein